MPPICDYKFSKYNVDICYNGDLYIFNLNSGALIQVDQDELPLLMNNNFSSINNSTLDELKKINILIPGDIDEFELLLEAQKVAAVSKNRQFCINVMTTTKCNARCYYCYEKDISDKKHMSKETVDQLIKYILLKRNGRTVHLKWFGGEPLCNTNVIDTVCKELKRLNIEYYSTMITNGLYVGKYFDKIKQAWNFRRVQITLDGVGETYNSIKNYSVWEDKNHFDILIENIHTLIDNEIFVSIRLNFNPLDYSDCLTLLDFIHKEFGNNKFLDVYCSHIYDENLPLPNDLTPNPYIGVYEKLIELGYVKNLSDLRVIRSNYYCGIKDREFVTVDPDGNLFKCEHEACHGKNNSFHNIFLDDSDINLENLDIWENTTEQPLCKDCNCYPICNGGCKYYELHGHNNDNCIQIRNCISDILKIFIKLHKEKCK